MTGVRPGQWADDLQISDYSGLPDAEARRTAVRSIDKHVLVDAGAGSGKTALLVDRYLYILAHDPEADVHSIAAITFTNKAAREMKQRLRARLMAAFSRAQDRGDAAAMRHWRRCLRALEAAPISTIHSLCARLLHQFPFAAGVDPQFRVMEEVEAQLYLPRVVEASLLDGLEEGRESAGRVIAYFENLRRASAVLEELVSKRELYAKWLDEPPPPGQVEEEWKRAEARWLAAQWKAFWRELEKNGLDERLEWAIGRARELAPAHPEEKLVRGLLGLAAILNAMEAAIADPLAAMRLVADVDELPPSNVGSSKVWGDEVKLARETYRDVKDLLLEIFRPLWRAELPSTETAYIAAAIWQEASHAARRWQSFKASIPALDFDDLQLIVRDALRDNREFRQACQALFRHILVDEFQDTNGLQQEIIWLLAGLEKPTREEPARVFIVGDAKQSIYRFRNADVTVYTRTRREFARREDAEAVRLEVSHRPHAGLMELFNELFAAEDMLGEPGPDREDFEAPYEDMVAVRLDEPARPSAEVVVVGAQRQAGRDRPREAEAAAVAQFIEHVMQSGLSIYDHAREGGPGRRRIELRDVAVLLRSARRVHIYERGLRERGVPFYNAAGRGFYRRQEVLDIAVALRAIAFPGDDVAVVGLLRSPMFSISDASLFWLSELEGDWSDKLAQCLRPGTFEQEPLSNIRLPERSRLKRAAELLQRWRGMRDRVPLSVLVQDILDQTGYPAAMAAQFAGRQAVANIAKLVEIARSFEATGMARVSDFVEFLRAMAIEDPAEAQAPTEEEESEAVRISTVHGAKGLQWPVVIVADTAWQPPSESGPVAMHPALGLCVAEVGTRNRFRLAGEVIRRFNYLEQRAEEGRLIYVAMTRASELVLVTGSLTLPDKDDAAIRRPGKNSWMGRLLAALGIKALPKLGELQREGGRQYIAGEPIGAWLVGEGHPEPVPMPEVLMSEEEAPTEAEEAGCAAGGEERAEAAQLWQLVVAPPPDAWARIAVTQLADYMRCPRFFYLRHVEGLPDMAPARPEPGGRLTALERGTVAHQLLQMILMRLHREGGAGPAIAERAAEELEAMMAGGLPGGGQLRRLSEEDRRVMRQLLGWFFEYPLFAELLASRRLQTEAWLAIQLSEAAVEGKVDVAAEMPGGLLLADYKTGRSDQRVRERDAFQVALYAWGLAQAQGQLPQRACIVYLAEREVRELEVGAEAERAARRAQRMVAAIRAGQFGAARDAARCAACPLRWACDISRGGE